MASTQERSQAAQPPQEASPAPGALAEAAAAAARAGGAGETGEAASSTGHERDTVQRGRDGGLCVLRLWPRTGRYHQLRKHCAYSGFPLLGDTVYR